jgi:hypothetical protein
MDGNGKLTIKVTLTVTVTVKDALLWTELEIVLTFCMDGTETERSRKCFRNKRFFVLNTVKIMILSRYRPITVSLPFSSHQDPS